MRNISPLFPLFANKTNSNHVKKLERATAFQKHGMAVLAALLVMLVGVYAAQAAPRSSFVQDTGAMALAVSDGLHEIIFTALEQAQENSAREFVLQSH